MSYGKKTGKKLGQILLLQTTLTQLSRQRSRFECVTMINFMFIFKNVKNKYIFLRFSPFTRWTDTLKYWDLCWRVFDTLEQNKTNTMFWTDIFFSIDESFLNKRCRVEVTSFAWIGEVVGAIFPITSAFYITFFC